MSANTWTRYADERPAVAGLYEWRMASKALPDGVLIVVAEMRVRGAGFKTVLSPEFDHWDGNRVLVPADLEWRQTNISLNPWQRTPLVLGVEGLDVAACSHCGNAPSIEAHQLPASGGIVVNPYPWELTHWRFVCCAWGRTPQMRDPREIERIRRQTRSRPPEVQS